MYEQFMSDFAHRDSAPWQVQLFYKLSEFSSDQPQGSLLHLLYIFSRTVVLRTLCLILNICYELIILV